MNPDEVAALLRLIAQQGSIIFGLQNRLESALMENAKLQADAVKPKPPADQR